MKYVLAIDQSTQGTKVLLLDSHGNIAAKTSKGHKQLVENAGYISHDLNEIYKNLIACVRECVCISAIDTNDIVSVGITNQRETTCVWDDTGPLAFAVVWQCSRAKDITDRLYKYGDCIHKKTGLPLSPYFSAAKMAWLLQNNHLPETYYLGTVDSFLIWKLTGNFYTDYSNASRTQLFNIKDLCWDDELCSIFGIDKTCLPKVCDSNYNFGTTDFEGVLKKPVPIMAVLGDSHAALYAHGCFNEGDVKVTYGTGSSVMMNIGEQLVDSDNRLASTIAWNIDGQVCYAIEGNINYSCAVISWLQDDLKLIANAKQVKELAKNANPNDTTVLVPAFSGLSAPYWKTNAKACLFGMSRLTTCNEVAKAAEESIAFQIADLLDCLCETAGRKIEQVYADGGAVSDEFLMQCQSDLSGYNINASLFGELSALGTARLAGITSGIYTYSDLDSLEYIKYIPIMSDEKRKEKRNLWSSCVNKL